MTRLFSADCSCSLSTSLRRIARSCRMPIVATSASAWPRARSGSGSGPGTLPNRFNAPIARPRSRSGSAWTERKSPRCCDCRHERRPPVGGLGEIGHAHRRRGLEAVQAGALVALQLQQLHDVRGLVGGGDRAQLPAGVAQHDAGRVGRQQLHAEAGQPIQQVDDVVLVDQGVRQGDERPADRLLAFAVLVGSSQIPLERSHRYSMFSVNASRRATTSRATSMSSRSCTNACARIRASASAALMSSCTDTIPVAWWISARWATA